MTGGFAGKATLTSPSGTLVDPVQPGIGKRTLVEQASRGAAAPQTSAGRSSSGAPVGVSPMANAGAVGPPAIELGDQEIGTQTFHEAMVWNLETSEASVTAHVEGDPSLQLVSAPARIFPSRELVNPDRRENKFRIVYSPTRRGRMSGILRVVLDWRAGVREPVELVIPIQGAAHAAGTLTLDEEAAE